jgi:NAD(P)-dependent dehydrogenase (short-subunit alcohol dehydrogenase family)
MGKKVCVIIGVGQGNGGALARAFSREGMSVALLARNTEFSAALASELGDARAYSCDASDPAIMADVFERIRDELGEPSILVYNAGSAVWGDAEHVALDDFEQAWRVNTLGALAASQQVIPAMRAQGSGSIIFIGATASLRGRPTTAAFASAKAAQRSLAESMARALWPVGIHVALIIIDAAVNLPRMRARMPDKPDDFFLQPEDTADTAVWLSKQPQSAWTFEVEVRPFGETW